MKINIQTCPESLRGALKRSRFVNFDLSAVERAIVGEIMGKDHKTYWKVTGKRLLKLIQDWAEEWDAVQERRRLAKSGFGAEGLTVRGRQVCGFINPQITRERWRFYRKDGHRFYAPDRKYRSSGKPDREFLATLTEPEPKAFLDAVDSDWGTYVHHGRMFVFSPYLAKVGNDWFFVAHDKQKPVPGLRSIEEWEYLKAKSDAEKAKEK